MVAALFGLLLRGWADWPGGGAVQPWARGMASAGTSYTVHSADRGPRSAVDRPAVAPPSADHRRDRPPSVSAAQIDAILATYHSPAAGLGAMFYDRGVAAGIDPAYLLAFFVVESAAGTRGVARTTHSLGNIRCTPGYACQSDYRAYPTWADGARDWYTLIRTLYLDTWDLRTPATILPRYAPPGDGNAPAAYAASVTHLVDGWTR